jgi:hypothetical protein
MLYLSAIAVCADTTCVPSAWKRALRNQLIRCTALAVTCYTTLLTDHPITRRQPAVIFAGSPSISRMGSDAVLYANMMCARRVYLV